MRLSGFRKFNGKACGFGNHPGQACGFTLAELLIALVILGVIATFTIPKMLSSQQDSKKKAIFKESISAFQEATNNMVLDGTIKTRSHTCGGSNSPVDPDLYANRINHLKRTDNSATSTSYLLANGSEVTVSIGEIVDFIVDYDGPDAGANTTGMDTVYYYFNDCNGSYAVLPVAKYGTLDHIPAGQVTENKALWEEIFKN